MNSVLFATDVLPPAGPYHHTIDGQIFTAVVITVLALYAIYVGYRNFIINNPTGEAAERN